MTQVLDADVFVPFLRIPGVEYQSLSPEYLQTTSTDIMDRQATQGEADAVKNKGSKTPLQRLR